MLISEDTGIDLCSIFMQYVHCVNMLLGDVNGVDFGRCVHGVNVSDLYFWNDAYFKTCLIKDTPTTILCLLGSVGNALKPQESLSSTNHSENMMWKQKQSPLKRMVQVSFIIFLLSHKTMLSLLQIKPL